MENKCPFCDSYCGRYILCAKHLKLLKDDTQKEAIKEFAKQTNLPKEMQNEFYKNAVFEFDHNYCYSNLTPIEAMEIIKNKFVKPYSYYLVGEKLKDIYHSHPDNYPEKQQIEIK